MVKVASHTWPVSIHQLEEPGTGVYRSVLDCCEARGPVKEKGQGSHHSSQRVEQARCSSVFGKVRFCARNERSP